MNYRQEYNESCITREDRGGIKTTFRAILGFRNPSASFEVAAREIFHRRHRIPGKRLPFFVDSII